MWIINLHVSRVWEADFHLMHFYSPSNASQRSLVIFLSLLPFPIFMCRCCASVCMSVHTCAGTGVGVHAHVEV